MRVTFTLFFVCVVATIVLLGGCNGKAKKFVGTYSRPAGATLVLNANGTGSAGGGFFTSSSFRWTVSGENTIQISDWDIQNPPVSGKCTFSPDGRFLDLEYGDGDWQNGFRKEE